MRQDKRKLAKGGKLGDAETVPAGVPRVSLCLGRGGAPFLWVEEWPLSQKGLPPASGRRLESLQHLPFLRFFQGETFNVPRCLPSGVGEGEARLTKVHPSNLPRLG